MIPDFRGLSKYLVAGDWVSEYDVSFGQEEAIYFGSCCHMAELSHLLKVVGDVYTVRVLKVYTKQVCFCGGRGVSVVMIGVHGRFCVKACLDESLVSLVGCRREHLCRDKVWIDDSLWSTGV